MLYRVFAIMLGLTIFWGDQSEDSTEWPGAHTGTGSNDTPVGREWSQRCHSDGGGSGSKLKLLPSLHCRHIDDVLYHYSIPVPSIGRVPGQDGCSRGGGTGREALGITRWHCKIESEMVQYKVVKNKCAYSRTLLKKVLPSSGVLILKTTVYGPTPTVYALTVQ